MVDIKKGESSFLSKNLAKNWQKSHFLNQVMMKSQLIITVVSDKLRGQKVGNALVEKIIGFAREENLKVVPVCSFVQKQFEKMQNTRMYWLNDPEG